MAQPIDLRSYDGDPMRTFTGDVVRIGGTADGCDLHVASLPAGAYVDLIRQGDGSWKVHAVGVAATPERLAIGDTLEIAGRRWVLGGSIAGPEDCVAVVATYGPPPSPGPGVMVERSPRIWLAIAAVAAIAAGGWWWLAR